VLAAWTLVIKFAFPFAFAWYEGTPLDTYIMWDFWWVIHLWLGWALLSWQRYTYALAVSVSVVEITIISVKLKVFLGDPSWTIWTANWFTNKLFVITCFVLMLGYFVAKHRKLRAF
jgi:hypothetical protein